MDLIEIFSTFCELSPLTMGRGKGKGKNQSVIAAMSEEPRKRGRPLKPLTYEIEEVEITEKIEKDEENERKRKENSDSGENVFALKDLYRTLNYPLVLQGWNGSDPCEESWAGVTCSGSSVIHLFLSAHFNVKILELTSILNLSHNFLSGPIGDVFNGLDNLKELYAFFSWSFGVAFEFQ
ncbi:hypothetical protein Lal_00036336 [Lupinus albus]|nr:hypothetical protein Lal_00036336 [Lupinus albus]